MRKYKLILCYLILEGETNRQKSATQPVTIKFLEYFVAARGYRKDSKLGPTMKARKMEQEQNED